MQEKVWKSRKIFLIFLITLLSIIVLAIVGLFIYEVIQIKKYDTIILPNTYLEKYSLSLVSFEDLDQKIDSYMDSILDSKIVVECNGVEYTYTYQDLGLSVNKNKIIDTITIYQNSLTYGEKFSILQKNERQVFKYGLLYDEELLRNFLTQLKSVVDVGKVDSYFSMSDDRVLQYVSGTNGYSLDIDKSLQQLVTLLQGSIGDYEKVTLDGVVDYAVNNESYQTIDTKVSSFVTTFDPYITRATNLKVALNYIDGAIILPGEIFSFYNYAGPYNKDGYVFYYEFVGNGVCQIATTIYNTALLGGLEIVKRYPHAAKSPYVAGGLDATVASYSSGWNVDFQFRNTYSYPIYVSAYAIGGEAHVDFWSNHDAMGGKTYSTESVQIAPRGYTTYLHTYQNGVEISRDKIATTWYTED